MIEGQIMNKIITVVLPGSIQIARENYLTLKKANFV